MPLRPLLIILLAVIFAAGVSVWLLSMGGPGVMVAALPAFAIAAVAVRVFRK